MKPKIEVYGSTASVSITHYQVLGDNEIFLEDVDGGASVDENGTAGLERYFEEGFNKDPKNKITFEIAGVKHEAEVYVNNVSVDGVDNVYGTTYSFDITIDGLGEDQEGLVGSIAHNMVQEDEFFNEIQNATIQGVFDGDGYVVHLDTMEGKYVEPDQIENINDLGYIYVPGEYYFKKRDKAEASEILLWEQYRAEMCYKQQEKVEA